MKALRNLSGTWNGIWSQHGGQGAMRLNLHFSAISLAGAGFDRVGPFTLSGTFSPDGVVKFTKRYSTHSVFYRGVWNGSLLSGMWALHREGEIETGEFEIWPEAAQVPLEDTSDPSRFCQVW